MITEHSFKIIDALIKQGRSFVLWRIPGEDYIHFGMQTAGAPDLLYDIQDLNGVRGFVFSPFHISVEHPIVVIRPDCFDLPDDILECPQEMIEVVTHDVPPFLTEEEEKRKYQYSFFQFCDPLLKGVQDKLVLSRSKTIRQF